eukprot:3798581-Alexandrium_andersonii.AAC.1
MQNDGRALTRQHGPCTGLTPRRGNPILVGGGRKGGAGPPPPTHPPRGPQRPQRIRFPKGGCQLEEVACEGR